MKEIGRFNLLSLLKVYFQVISLLYLLVRMDITF